MVRVIRDILRDERGKRQADETLDRVVRQRRRYAEMVEGLNKRSPKTKQFETVIEKQMALNTQPEVLAMAKYRATTIDDIGSYKHGAEPTRLEMLPPDKPPPTPAELADLRRDISTLR